MIKSFLIPISFWIAQKAEKKKPTARVALLIGCGQRVVSPQINESTIRILTRHGVEVITMPEVECCGSLNHHLGKEDIAKETFKKNINLWYDEYLKNGLDAIISNTSGCGTTLKDYGFIFREDKELKKKAKKISELTKDVREFLDVLERSDTYINIQYLCKRPDWEIEVFRKGYIERLVNKEYTYTRISRMGVYQHYEQLLAANVI